MNIKVVLVSQVNINEKGVWNEVEWNGVEQSSEQAPFTFQVVASYLADVNPVNQHSAEIVGIFLVLWFAPTGKLTCLVRMIGTTVIG